MLITIMFYNVSLNDLKDLNLICFSFLILILFNKRLGKISKNTVPTYNNEKCFMVTV